jgi:hypothetical protein
MGMVVTSDKFKESILGDGEDSIKSKLKVALIGKDKEENEGKSFLQVLKFRITKETKKMLFGESDAKGKKIKKGLADKIQSGFYNWMNENNIIDKVDGSLQILTNEVKRLTKKAVKAITDLATKALKKLGDIALKGAKKLFKGLQKFFSKFGSGRLAKGLKSVGNKVAAGPAGLIQKARDKALSNQQKALANGEIDPNDPKYYYLNKDHFQTKNDERMKELRNKKYKEGLTAKEKKEMQDLKDKKKLFKRDPNSFNADGSRKEGADLKASPGEKGIIDAVSNGNEKLVNALNENITKVIDTIVSMKDAKVEANKVKEQKKQDEIFDENRNELQKVAKKSNLSEAEVAWNHLSPQEKKGKTKAEFIKEYEGKVAEQTKKKVQDSEENKVKSSPLKKIKKALKGELSDAELNALERDAALQGLTKEQRVDYIETAARVKYEKSLRGQLQKKFIDPFKNKINEAKRNFKRKLGVGALTDEELDAIQRDADAQGLEGQERANYIMNAAADKKENSGLLGIIMRFIKNKMKKAAKGVKKVARNLLSPITGGLTQGELDLIAKDADEQGLEGQERAHYILAAANYKKQSHGLMAKVVRPLKNKAKNALKKAKLKIFGGSISDSDIDFINRLADKKGLEGEERAEYVLIQMKKLKEIKQKGSLIGKAKNGVKKLAKKAVSKVKAFVDAKKQKVIEEATSEGKAVYSQMSEAEREGKTEAEFIAEYIEAKKKRSLVYKASNAFNKVKAALGRGKSLFKQIKSDLTISPEEMKAIQDDADTQGLTGDQRAEYIMDAISAKKREKYKAFGSKVKNKVKRGVKKLLFKVLPKGLSDEEMQAIYKDADAQGLTGEERSSYILKAVANKKKGKLVNKINNTAFNIGYKIGDKLGKFLLNGMTDDELIAIGKDADNKGLEGDERAKYILKALAVKKANKSVFGKIKNTAKKAISKVKTTLGIGQMSKEELDAIAKDADEQGLEGADRAQYIMDAVQARKQNGLVNKIKTKVKTKLKGLAKKAFSKLTGLSDEQLDAIRKDADERGLEGQERSSYILSAVKANSPVYQKINGVKNKVKKKVASFLAKRLTSGLSDEEIRAIIQDADEQGLEGEARSSYILSAIRAKKKEKGSKLKNKVKDKFNSMKNKAKEKFGDLKSKGKEKFNSMKEKGKNAFSKAKDTGKKALDKGKEAFGKAKDKSAEMLANAKVKGQETIQKIQEKATIAREKAKDLAQAAREKTADIAQAAREKSADAKQMAREKSADLWQKLKEKKDSAFQLLEQGKEAAHNAKKQAQEFIHQKAEFLKDKIFNMAKRGLEAAVSGAKNIIELIGSGVKSVLEVMSGIPFGKVAAIGVGAVALGGLTALISKTMSKAKSASNIDPNNPKAPKSLDVKDNVSGKASSKSKKKESSAESSGDGTGRDGSRDKMSLLDQAKLTKKKPKPKKKEKGPLDGVTGVIMSSFLSMTPFGPVKTMGLNFIKFGGKDDKDVRQSKNKNSSISNQSTSFKPSKGEIDGGKKTSSFWKKGLIGTDDTSQDPTKDGSKASKGGGLFGMFKSIGDVLSSLFGGSDSSSSSSSGSNFTVSASSSSDSSSGSSTTSKVVSLAAVIAHKSPMISAIGVGAQAIIDALSNLGVSSGSSGGSSSDDSGSYSDSSGSSGSSSSSDSSSDSGSSSNSGTDLSGSTGSKAYKKGGKAGSSSVFNKKKKGKENLAKQMWDYYRSIGFSEGATAGILGNAEQESDIDPLSNLNNNKTQYKGIFQLSINDRFANMKKWAKKRGLDWKSAEAQTRFSVQELIKGPRSKNQFPQYTGMTGSQYPKIKDPAKAAHAWVAGFEGATDGHGGWQDDGKRQAYAKTWYKKFKGRPVKSASKSKSKKSSSSGSNSTITAEKQYDSNGNDTSLSTYTAKRIAKSNSKKSVNADNMDDLIADYSGAGKNYGSYQKAIQKAMKESAVSGISTKNYKTVMKNIKMKNKKQQAKLKTMVKNYFKNNNASKDDLFGKYSEEDQSIYSTLLDKAVSKTKYNRVNNKNYKNVLKNLKAARKKAKKTYGKKSTQYKNYNKVISAVNDGFTKKKSSSSSSSSGSGNDWLSHVLSVKKAFAARYPTYYGDPGPKNGYFNLKLGKKTRSVRPDCSGLVSAMVSSYSGKNYIGTSYDFNNKNNSTLKSIGFKARGWRGWSDLNEGDIIARDGHVEVFAGRKNGTNYVYNGGSTTALRAAGKTVSGHSSYTTVWSPPDGAGKVANVRYQGKSYNTNSGNKVSSKKSSKSSNTSSSSGSTSTASSSGYTTLTSGYTTNASAASSIDYTAKLNSIIKLLKKINKHEENIETNTKRTNTHTKDTAENTTGLKKAIKTLGEGSTNIFNSSSKKKKSSSEDKYTGSGGSTGKKKKKTSSNGSGGYSPKVSTGTFSIAQGN